MALEKQYGNNVQCERWDDNVFEITGLTLDDLYAIKEACSATTGRARQIARILVIACAIAEQDLK